MSPRYEVDDIDPASILDICCPERTVGGSITVALIARYVPLNEVEGLGRVLTKGIAEHLGFNETDAEILTERVEAHLRTALWETLRGESEDETI